MNKLIKQLADRAAQYADGYDDRHEPIWWQFYDERFAELIIRECAKIADDGYASSIFGNGITGR